ncbi:MAG: hypothetical protein GY816_11035, partial [Cytophagales bacterium]|nr:hypothetical protein [Cytophagales bacterium]
RLVEFTTTSQSSHFHALMDAIQDSDPSGMGIALVPYEDGKKRAVLVHRKRKRPLIGSSSRLEGDTVRFY